MIYVILLFAILILDHATKIFAAAQGAGWDVTIIPEILSFTYVKNTGAAFSSFAGKEWAQTFFIVITCIVLPILYVVFLRLKNDRKWLKTTIILLIAGTIGNFIDRLLFQGVTDFINVHFFANFNVADIALTDGAIMLVFYFLFLDDDALIPVKKKSKGKNNG